MGGKKYLEGTRIEDIVGQKFGKLTVVEFDWDRYSNNHNRKHDYFWVCKCECGKYNVVQRDCLLRGTTKSCGNCISFYDWCMSNEEFKCYLELWDYELNKCSPSDIGKSSNKKFYFKCEAGTHCSELWMIHSLTNIREFGSPQSKIFCRACNSIGQYLMDRDGNLDAWSDKNKVDPFTVAKKASKKVWIKCLDCNKEKLIMCNDFISYTLSCSCGDGYSYPNKFVTSFLKQISVDFDTEKIFDWDKTKRYDHYVSTIDCIIENHGGQHYEDCASFKTLCGRTLNYEQENDKLKEKLALSNGVKHYIQLDCRKSDMEWIKNSIMNSELPELLGFKEEGIDWVGCEKFALSNLVKEACDLWSSGRFMTTSELGREIGISSTTVRRYLKGGSKCGWCNYNPKDEWKKCREKAILKTKRKVSILKNGIVIGEFDSITELEKQSEILYGVKLLNSAICMVCKRKMSTYKGFTFRYIEDNDNTYIAS